VVAAPSDRVLLTHRVDLLEAREPFAIWEANPSHIPY
jgi:hypothetical protein